MPIFDGCVFDPLVFDAAPCVHVAGGRPAFRIVPDEEDEQQAAAEERRRKRRKAREERRARIALAAMVEEMRTQRRRREEDWLLGLFTDEQYARAA